MKQTPTAETDLMSLPTAQATSTPTMSTRKLDSLNETAQSSTATMIIHNQTPELITAETIKDTKEMPPQNPIFTITSEDDEEDEDEENDDDVNSDDDHFYEHDERVLNKHATNSAETSMSNGDLSHHHHHDVTATETRRQSKWKHISYTLCIILIVLLVFFLFLFLIQHWKCKLSSDIDNENNIIKVNLNSCGYQKTLSRLSDNFNLFLQELFNLVFLNASSDRNKWIRWPIKSAGQHDVEHTTCYDPLFFWFFKQYQEN